MKRWLAVAALGAALIALPASGQRRGGGFGGHASFGFHGAAIGRGGMGIGRGSGFSGRGPRPGGGFNRPYFSHSRSFTRRGRFRYGGYSAYPYYGYPYFGYPYNYDYGDDGYYAPENYADDGGEYVPDQADQQQQAEIDRLENEVERLRQERGSTASPPASSKSDRVSFTELVFRDKHTQEVENYAITGQTFWIFDGQRTKKIPIAELDVPATIKANDARGVDFQLPQ